MKRHGLDPFSLVFGAAFAALGVLFLFTDIDPGTWNAVSVLPVPLIFFGLIMLAVGLRRRQSTTASSTAEDD